jgi:NAD(P)-dependent dehydrogenase (short-subunit alcohol dehydrogenase family)
MAYEPMNLSGKVALVTGGNSGIGLGMAMALAQAGADVCVWGTNPTKNDDALAHLRRTGAKVEAMICDVSDEAAVEASFAATVEEFGKVDGVFANAGVGGNGSPFIEISTEEWRRVLGVNLDGVFWTFRAAAKHMVERGEGGRLVGTSSVSTIHGAPRSEPYASSKGAMISMVRGLSVELARYGITANTIIPGWIETPMTERSFGNEVFENAVKKRIPERRWGQGADFGGLAVYLMSDASEYHTGDQFVIDGGYTRF